MPAVAERSGAERGGYAGVPPERRYAGHSVRRAGLISAVEGRPALPSRCHPVPPCRRATAARARPQLSVAPVAADVRR